MLSFQVEDLHLVREKDTGKSKGFAFLKYEDQRSTVLAVDNFNGIKVRMGLRGSSSSSTITTIIVARHHSIANVAAAISMSPIP